MVWKPRCSILQHLCASSVREVALGGQLLRRRLAFGSECDKERRLEAQISDVDRSWDTYVEIVELGQRVIVGCDLNVVEG